MWIAAAVLVLLFGAYWFNTQRRDQVYIRDPGYRSYYPAIPIAMPASQEWEYAVLADNVYAGQWDGGGAASTARRDRLPLADWHRWERFPSASLAGEADKTGLYFEVWETETAPARIAVVFRGTDGWSDWLSNLRWFLRFVPFWEDQYHLVSRLVGEEFSARIRTSADRYGSSGLPLVITAGHSLGGGLAQHFAYSLPPDERVPRVSRVFAFDPSPVTGWSSVPAATRSHNASELRIDRVFEHGEILAYVRLVLSYVNPPSARAPAVTEIRYNFEETLNPLASHSMHDLARQLVEASGHAQ